MLRGRTADQLLHQTELSRSATLTETRSRCPGNAVDQTELLIWVLTILKIIRIFTIFKYFKPLSHVKWRF